MSIMTVIIILYIENFKILKLSCNLRINKTYEKLKFESELFSLCLFTSSFLLFIAPLFGEFFLKSYIMRQTTF
jgi:hypothetical protein